MTPIAAYYIFTANEHERAEAAVHGLPVRNTRPSLLARLRSLGAALRPNRSVARPA